MIGDGAVGGLIFKVAVRGDQHAGHHGQRAGGGGDEVAHDVAVVVFAGPDDAAGGADDLGRHVVDEGVAIGETRLFKGRPVLLVVHLLKQQLEGLVVVLGDGILAGKPHVLSHGEAVGEAAPGKGENGIVPVVHGLKRKMLMPLTSVKMVQRRLLLKRPVKPSLPNILQGIPLVGYQNKVTFS